MLAELETSDGIGLTGVPCSYASAFAFQHLELLLRDRAGVEQLLGLRDVGSRPAARRPAHVTVELSLCACA